MNKINCIGIGAQKSATTWIYKMLDAHSNTCMAHSKEIHYFSRHFNKSADWYESKFSHCNDGSLIRGEISTSYLSDKKAPKRIHEYNSDMKIIVSLRNPVDRAISHINHLHSKKKISHSTSLKIVLRKYPEVIENGLYGKYLEKYLDIFPQEQVLIIKFKDIKNNPKTVIHRIYKFLNIDKLFSPNILNEKYNTSKQRSSFLYRSTAKIHQKLKRSKAGDYLLDVLRKLGVNHTLVKRVLETSPSRTQPEFSKDDINYLRSLFIDDIKALDRITDGNYKEAWIS